MEFLQRLFRPIFRVFQNRGSSYMAPSTEKLIWVDLEMSGLDVNKERIIEMAVAVTDSDLESIIEGPELIIHQSDEVMDAMDDWNTNQHGKSGLTELVRKSEISEQQAEQTMLEFIQKHTTKGKCPLAGNSIYMDKMFLMKYMPNFCDHLHHRLVDVSTIKELAKRWSPDLLNSAPTKSSSHRAMDDIKESIAELKYYKRKLF